MMFGLVAQALTMGSSLLILLMFPKIMNAESFAYWQLFLFYCAYTGFLLLGLNDGIYLLYGGRQKNSVNPAEIRGQVVVAILLQLILCILVLIICFTFVSSRDRLFVVLGVLVFAFLGNVAAVIGYFYQAVNETKISAIGVIISKTVLVLCVVSLVLAAVEDYRVFVVLFSGCQGLALLYYFTQDKSYLLGTEFHFKKALRASLDSMKVGLNLMLANTVGMLILGFGRVLVDFKFGIVEFSKVSLALTAVNFVLQFVTQVSMVLFPALRYTDHSRLVHFHKFISYFSLCGFAIAYVVSFPMFIVLKHWLPQYSDALEAIFILMPICIFDGHASLSSGTMLKVLRMERALLLVNIVAMGFSVMLLGAVSFIRSDLVFLLYILVFCIIIRALLADLVVMRALKTISFSIQLESVTLALVFMLTFTYSISLGSWLVFCFVYLLFLFLNFAKMKSYYKLFISANHRSVL